MVQDLTSLNCMQSVYICDDKEVVFSCKANCNEVIYWWNGDRYFCTQPVLNDSKDPSIPGSKVPADLEVIHNNCNLTSSGTFTSQLTLRFNARLNVTNNADTQIGCFIAPDNGSGGQVFPNNPCIPREPSAGEQNSNITLRAVNCTGTEKHIITL